jgi:hypothetical protein
MVAIGLIITLLAFLAGAPLLGAASDQGFRDEQDGSISAQEMRTDFIDPARIVSGELLGWREVPNDEGTKVECNSV